MTTYLIHLGLYVVCTSAVLWVFCRIIDRILSRILVTHDMQRRRCDVAVSESHKARHDLIDSVEKYEQTAATIIESAKDVQTNP